MNLNYNINNNIIIWNLPIYGKKRKKKLGKNF